MTQHQAPSPSWDLESLYPGGAGGPAIAGQVEHARVETQRLIEVFSELPVPHNAGDIHDRWAVALLELEKLDDVLTDTESYALCSTAADTADDHAKVVYAKAAEIQVSRQQIDVPLWAKLSQITSEDFDRLLARDDLSHMSMFLTEIRRQAEISMGPELEELQTALSRDGIHAWARLYDTVSGVLRVVVDRGNGDEELTDEQARCLLESPDTELREKVAKAIHKAWNQQVEITAAALNHINGFRHVVYRRRDIDELEIPLRMNRMARSTLETMFAVIDDFKPVLTRYLEAKAKVLGLKELRWYDLDVPLGVSEEVITYDEAQDFIVEHFGRFSSSLGDFANHALKSSYVEAENRTGKRGGGFCTSFPLKGQSRIFMTYADTRGSLQTLAHELGHAYHSNVLLDLPSRMRQYPMALAETASTFAESLVRQAAYEAATDDATRFEMLDGKLSDAVTFLMNIPGRFQFERSMYAARANGELRPTELTDLCVGAFKHAYNNALGEYQSLFWSSKLHFFFTDVPFYNFPYSVGYLFSAGLFARALEEGSAFAERYRQLLRLTGHKTVEQVGQEALGIDLGQPEFWQSALSVVESNVNDFVELAQRGRQRK